MTTAKRINKITKYCKLIYLFAATVIVVAALFKVMHWPYSEEFELLKMLAMGIGFIALLHENLALKAALKNKT